MTEPFPIGFAAKTSEMSIVLADKAACYARYSSDNQDSSTIQQQIGKSREQSAKDGLPLPDELIFLDEAVSGQDPNRAGLLAMLAAAREGRFRTLYVWSVSRIGRDVAIAIPIFNELVDFYGIRVVSVSQGIDSNQPGWRMAMQLHAIMDEEYIRALSANVRSGQEYTLMSGYSCGDLCYGYRSEPIPGTERKGNAKPRKRILIDDVERLVVIQIFYWFVVEKRDIAWIVRELNLRGFSRDTRSKVSYWYHDIVHSILRNSKYTGRWPHGMTRRKRHPATGKMKQMRRPAEEVKVYERPELRIIDDETFFEAQKLLAENDARHARFRTPDGRLHGSTRDLAKPCHLLQGLFKCAACGFPVRTVGPYYMCCPNRSRGTCQVRARLKRTLVERLIVDTVSTRLTADSAWSDEVFKFTLSSWEAQTRSLPNELVQVDHKIKELEGQIKNLLDKIEKPGIGDVVVERLAARRNELREFQRRREELVRSADRYRTQPTREWVQERLARLCEVLSNGGSGAAVALRNLLGPVDLTEVPHPTNKRKTIWRANLRLETSAMATAIAPDLVSPPDGQSRIEEIVLDLVELPTFARISNNVKALFDQGVFLDDIACQFECHRNYICKSLRYWHEVRGLEYGDGRHRKRRRKPKPEAQARAVRIVELWIEDLLIIEIANHVDIKCNRETVTKVINEWYQSRGQTMPDGRARRKEVNENRRREAEGKERS